MFRIFLFSPFIFFSRADLFWVLVRFNVTTSPAFNLLATPFGQSNKAQEIKERISGRWRNSTFGEKILWNTSTSTPFVHGKKMLSPGSAVTAEKTGRESTFVAIHKTLYGLGTTADIPMVPFVSPLRHHSRVRSYRKLRVLIRKSAAAIASCQ